MTSTILSASDPNRDPLYHRLIREVRAADVPAGPADPAPVAEADVAGLPPVVRRYLGFMGVVGRPRVRSLTARFAGRFRLRPRLGWMPAQAWQYNTSPDVTRVFVMRVRLAGVVPMVGRDTYLRGNGHMLGRLLDRVTVVEGQGEEFDIGELTTYLNDAILMAPSMLLTPATAWSPVDDHTFEVCLTDAGRTVRARVFVDERGAPYDFSTTDRYADLPGGLIRAEWHTPVRDWHTVDGRAVPGRVAAVWHLPGGPLPYVTGGLTHLAHNVTLRPLAAGRASSRRARP
ncbi:hypothetical protein ADK57_38400 [Streptomyces sp. MMG1533]|uniref:DUF6544 family protein n=1 Tax=Streptomyces sp. MMG1533 TaxID=1415546 RepID=UPI0006B0407F|nr:DUF6544 family protein [Streptomyces sp. MMG1533]KOU57481.1 hypothetical protein ADK57_38400 [Streptomyces sp. MMG1533]